MYSSTSNHVEKANLFQENDDGNNEKAMEIMIGDETFEQGHRNDKNVWAEA
jgi:hypothetical protein